MDQAGNHFLGLAHQNQEVAACTSMHEEEKQRNVAVTSPYKTRHSVEFAGLFSLNSAACSIGHVHPYRTKACAHHLPQLPARFSTRSLTQASPHLYTPVLKSPVFSTA
eukprot:1160149-Pelagomonas_calceolata.AAC.4